MVRIYLHLLAVGKFLSSASPPLRLSFSFYLSLFVFIRLFLWLCFSAFWNLTTLVNDKLWVQVGVAAVGWEPHLVQSCAIHWRWQEGLWLWVFDLRFFIFTRKESKDEAVDVNSCPRWLNPNKEAVSLAGGLLPIPDTTFIGPDYEPGQLLNPVQPALRNLGPGNKGVGEVMGIGWSWGDRRWKLKDVFRWNLLVL